MHSRQEEASEITLYRRDVCGMQRDSNDERVGHAGQVVVEEERHRWRCVRILLEAARDAAARERSARRAGEREAARRELRALLRERLHGGCGHRDERGPGKAGLERLRLENGPVDGLLHLMHLLHLHLLLLLLSVRPLGRLLSDERDGRQTHECAAQTRRALMQRTDAHRLGPRRRLSVQRLRLVRLLFQSPSA